MSFTKVEPNSFLEKRNVINISTIIIEFEHKHVFKNSDYIDIEIRLEKYYLELSEELWFRSLTCIKKALFIVLFYYIGTTKDHIMPNTRKSLRSLDFKSACANIRNSTLDTVINPTLLHNILKIIEIGGE
jgi:hypothetical protein